MENSIALKEEKINSLIEIGKEINITCDDENIFASEHLILIKLMRKDIANTFDPILKKNYDGYKKTRDEIQGQKDKHDVPLKVIESEVENKIKTFRAEMETKRIEQERKLQELARKEEEKIKKTLEERIKKAKEKGNLEKVEALQEQKDNVFIPAPIVQSQFTKVASTGIIKTWTFEIVDEKLIPREYLEVNKVLLGKIARAEKGIRQIAGVKFYCR